MRIVLMSRVLVNVELLQRCHLAHTLRDGREATTDTELQNLEVGERTRFGRELPHRLVAGHVQRSQSCGKGRGFFCLAGGGGGGPGGCKYVW